MNKKVIGAEYCSRELCALLDKKGIEAHHVMAFVKSGSWYKKYTQDVVCRWLREKYRLQVDADETTFFQERPKKIYYKWCPLIIRLSDCKIKLNSHNASQLDNDYICHNGGYCSSYEEARELAIRYCVENLI